MIKKNIKVISIFILGVFCAIGITISAYVVTGKNVLVKSTGWNVKNVEEAVNYLKDENSCHGLAPKIANITSGDKNTVGSIVKIGNEDFYVLGPGSGSEAGKTKLLTKYVLKNNSQVSSGAGETVKFSESNYWANTGLNYNSTPYPYVYNSNSNLYTIVNRYAEKIASLGISSVTGRLMSYEEAQSLPLDIRKYPSADYYWLGTASSDSWIYNVTSSGGYYQSEQFNIKSIRPVILIPTNEIG